MNLKAGLNKIWHVAFFEYQSRVLTWRFWLGIVALPVLLALMMGLTTLALFLAQDTAPVGVVGGRGLDLTPPAGERFRHTFVAMTDEQAARAALLAGEVQAYYVLPADYPIERSVSLYYLKRPASTLAR